MSQAQPNHFTIITIKNKYLAKTVAKALFKKFESVVDVVDSTAFEGHNLEVEDRFADREKEMKAYAEATRDFLEKVVDFDDLP